jgi:hypothetical protein
VLGRAAVAKIQAHDVEARDEGFGRRAENVDGRTGAFEPVHEHDGRARVRLFLPATVGEQLHAFLDFKEALLILLMRAILEAARPGVSD